MQYDKNDKADLSQWRLDSHIPRIAQLPVTIGLNCILDKTHLDNHRQCQRTGSSNHIEYTNNLYP